MKQVSDLYGAFRFSSPDAALDVLGSWMQQNSDLKATFAFRFGQANYDTFHQLADMLTRQYEPHSKLFQDRSLVAEDGAVHSPSAQTMAFIRIAQDDWSGWVSLLDSRAKDESLSGDARATWLIARAVAEEVRFSSESPYARPNVRPLDGARFLREGIATASSRLLKERAYHELIARYASERDFTEAEKLMREAATIATDSTVSHWQEEIDRLRQALKLDLELQVLQREASRRGIYQKYLDKARESSDQRAIQLYERLIRELD
jgi:hypothetical protein